ncbi:MAG: ribonuclease J [Hyphomicrobiales bacterium]
MTSQDLQNKTGELVFLSLGGIGEIGMNCSLYGLGPAGDRRWLMVDLGMTFAGEHEPGIDVILPDISFIEGERYRLLGLVATHAHEDHIGAIAHLWPRLRAPIYATKFAASLLAHKLDEAGIEGEVPLRVIPGGHRFTLECFDIELVGVNHSTPESNAVIIRTPLGTVVHSGDWRIDRRPMLAAATDETRLRCIGREGCLALVCDSTNAMSEGDSPGERDVAETLAKLIHDAERRVVITSFASNVARLNAVERAARTSGRRIVTAGRSMRRVIEAAHRCGYLKDMAAFLPEEAFADLPPEQVVCLCTGSQGEPRAAMARIADNSHPLIALDEGDLVIFSSKTIPGNERAVIAIENRLARRGIDVVTEHDALVHVTGHPRREDLKQFYRWVRPRYVVPIHGEARHIMAHAGLARDAGLAALPLAGNGRMLRLAPGKPEIIDEVPHGRLMVDGQVITRQEGAAMRTRRKLSWAGMIVVSLVIDAHGERVGAPQIIMAGIAHETATATPTEAIIHDLIEDTFTKLAPTQRCDTGHMGEALRRSIRRAMLIHWGKKPLCRVIIHRN